MEYGLVLPQGITYIPKLIPSILEDAENELTVLLRELLVDLYCEMIHLDKLFQMLETKLEVLSERRLPAATEHSRCRATQRDSAGSGHR